MSVRAFLDTLGLIAKVVVWAALSAFFLALVLIGLWWLAPDDWPIKYAAEYWIDTNQVVVERKPHNCEWGSAPIGEKHCHYKAIVTLYDSAGHVIRDENVSPTKIHVEWERIEE